MLLGGFLIGGGLETTGSSSYDWFICGCGVCDCGGGGGGVFFNVAGGGVGADLTGGWTSLSGYYYSS